MKKFLKILLIILLIVVLVALCYLGYVLTTYYRVEDNQELTVVNGGMEGKVPVGTELTIESYNIGFAAYTPDFSFFMDGGKYSRAFSKESVIDDMNSIRKHLDEYNADFYFVQEVDTDSTRSYNVNEYELLVEPFADKSVVFAQNYDSPYLFYPFIKPHGASKSGIVTMSTYDITSSIRRSLPIQTDFAKFLDLDRCYSVSRVPTANGKELVLINFHLSAYTTDPTVGDQQLQMIYDQVKAEVDKGNYVICGGDFNKDLLRDSSKYFGIPSEDWSWAKSFPYDTLPDFLKVVAPLDSMKPIPSCRNANMPWDPETNFQITIDGFMVTNNIEVVSTNVVDLQFAYSDHNPVYMTFKLK